MHFYCRGEKGWPLNCLNCTTLIRQVRSPQIPSMLLIPSLISRLVFHSSWDEGAPRRCRHCCRRCLYTQKWWIRFQYAVRWFVAANTRCDRWDGVRWKWLIVCRNRNIAAVLLHRSGKSMVAESWWSQQILPGAERIIYHFRIYNCSVFCGSCRNGRRQMFICCITRSLSVPFSRLVIESTQISLHDTHGIIMKCSFRCRALVLGRELNLIRLNSLNC